MLALPWASAAEPATAEKYPGRPVRIIVGLAAGGGTDLIARLIAPKLSESLGQQFIVENKPGGNFALSTDAVLKAPADGHTLMLAPSGVFVASPVMYEKLPYAPGDFAPISLVCTFPLILSVNANLPARDLREFIAYLKANPGKMNYSGSTVAFQLPMELFLQRTGTAMQFIQYKGSNLSVNAVLSGEVTATLVDSGPVIGLIKGGRIRGLAITSATRSSAFPDIPTMTELGFPELRIDYWMGLFARVQTPTRIIKLLETEVNRVLSLADVQSAMRTRLVEPAGGSAESLARFIASEHARWESVRAKAGIPRIK